MKNKSAIAFAALAAVSLLAATAVADGSWRGMGDHGQRGCSAGPNGAWALLIDDATAENWGNMTLAEIEALKQEKMAELDNMTISEIEALRQQKMEVRDNMTLSQLKAKRPLGQADRAQGEMGQCRKGDFLASKGPDFPAGLGSHFGGIPFLLMDDVSEEELNNMTLAEIRNLREQKMAELENMTLSEIQELWQQKMEERNNMTLSELRGQGEFWPGMAGPMMGPSGRMGSDRQNGQPGQYSPGPRR